MFLKKTNPLQFLLIPLFIQTQIRDILTWIVEFRPGNKTIYVVFDEESEISGPRKPKLSPDQVFEEKRTLSKILTIICLRSHVNSRCFFSR